MKRLILFRGGVETLEYFSLVMSEEWEKLGYEIFWFDLIFSEESSRTLLDLYEANKQDEFFAFTFNFEGIAGEEGPFIKDDNGKIVWSIWDYAEIHVVNMVVDHPLYYHKYLSVLPKNYIQLDVDRVHVDYMKRFFPQVNNVYFMPLGGTALGEPEGARPIDVLFAGNFTPKHMLRQHLNGMEDEYVEFYEKMLDKMIENPDSTIDEIAEGSLKEEFPDITDEQLKDCMPNMMYVDLAVRFHFRELAVRALAEAGIRVHTYGEGYNYLQCNKHENIVEHGGVNSLKCLQMMTQAKVSLNVMPWFKCGAHDRVFNSLLNGAVPFTDDSEYLKEIFTDKENILFYDLKTLREYEKSGFDEELACEFARPVKEYLKGFNSHITEDKAKDLVKDKTKDIVINGKKICEQAHTWNKRVQKIDEIMKMCYNTVR